MRSPKRGLRAPDLEISDDDDSIKSARRSRRKSDIKRGYRREAKTPRVSDMKASKALRTPSRRAPSANRAAAKRRPATAPRPSGPRPSSAAASRSSRRPQKLTVRTIKSPTAASRTGRPVSSSRSRRPIRPRSTQHRAKPSQSLRGRAAPRRPAPARSARNSSGAWSTKARRRTSSGTAGGPRARPSSASGVGRKSRGGDARAGLRVEGHNPRFVTTFHTPRCDDLRLQAKSNGREPGDRGEYIGDLRYNFHFREPMQERHIKAMGKPDFKTKFKVPTTGELGINGKRVEVLSASERKRKVKGQPAPRASHDLTKIRPLAKKAWVELENPGRYNQHQGIGPEFRTAFRTPRGSDLRVEASLNGHDRGPYIGSLRAISIGDMDQKIDEALVETGRMQKGELTARRERRSPKTRFKLNFKKANGMQGLDGRTTELISASDRRKKMSTDEPMTSRGGAYSSRSTTWRAAPAVITAWNVAEGGAE